MKYIFSYLPMALMIFLSNAYSQDCIVKIGGTCFSQTQINAFRASADVDPMQSVEKIRREVGIKDLVGLPDADISVAEKQLYERIFGVNIEDDRTKAAYPDLPMQTRFDAGARIDMFEEIVATHAEGKIPIVFLNPAVFWDLVKQTNLYRVRKEAGFEPKMENWQYTWAELALDDGIVVAAKKGKPFLSGAEYNIYIKTNYDGLRHFCTRALSVRSVQAGIAKEILRGKVIIGKLATKEIAIKSNEAEAALNRYIRKVSLVDQPDLKGLPNNTLAQLQEQLYSRWEIKNRTKKDKLMSMIQGITPTESAQGRDALLLIEAGNNALYRQTKETINEKDVYDWMKAEKFKGSLNDALHVMAQDRMQDNLDKELAASGVEIVLK